MRRARVAAVLAGCLVLSACSTSSTTSSTAPEVVETSVATTTTVAVPPPTTTLPTETTQPESLDFDPTSAASVEDFDTTGDDLTQVLVNWDGMFNFLEAHPTGTAEEMVNRLYGPEFPNRSNLLAGFAELVDNGWSYADPGEDLIAVQVLEQGETTAVVRVATSRGEQVLVDASGTEVKRYLGWEPKYSDLRFARADGASPWLAVDHLGSQPLTPDILDEMIPVEWMLR